MKNLIFLTSHRQIDEIYLYGEFLKRTKNLKDFDFILHNNNPNIDISSVYSNIPNKNKNFIVTSKNCGYSMGPHEAISDNFEMIKNYDNVIHSHPDVYPVDGDKLIDIINQHLRSAFLVNFSVPNDKNWMSTDLFIFRPKLLSNNPFRDYVDNLNINCETFLYKIAKELPHNYIQRFENDNWEPRRICMWGCLHEHNIDSAKRYL